MALMALNGRQGPPGIGPLARPDYPFKQSADPAQLLVWHEMPIWHIIRARTLVKSPHRLRTFLSAPRCLVAQFHGGPRPARAKTPE